MREAIPDLDAQMEAGELATARPTGSATTSTRSAASSRPKETIERLTGSPTIDPQPYLAYLREKLAALAA